MRISYLINSLFNDYPVFIDYRNNVRQCADSRKVGIFFIYSVAVALKSANKLENHADACVFTEITFAVRAMRINNGNSLGKNVADFMVVCYYDINTQFICKPYLLNCRNSVIDGNNKLCSVLGKILYSLRRNSVALRHSVGDIIIDICPLLSQIEVQKRCRGNTVGVIVAENCNFFARIDSTAYTLDRLIHIDNFKRVPEKPVGKKEALNFLRVCHFP